MGNRLEEEVEILKKRNPETRTAIREAIRDKMYDRVYDVEEVKQKLREYHGRDIFGEVHESFFGKSNRHR